MGPNQNKGKNDNGIRVVNKTCGAKTHVHHKPNPNGTQVVNKTVH